MISVYPSGQTLIHRFELVDGQGLPVTVQNDAGSYTLYDDAGDVVTGPTVVDTSLDPDYVDISIAPEHNATAMDESRAFRRLVFSFDSSDGSHYESTIVYIVEASNMLEVGLNSFAVYGELMIAAQDYPELNVFHAAGEREQKAALINAYYNIANLSIILECDPISTLDLTASDIVALDSNALRAFKYAQIIEANSVLGGNPVEDRRRMGLLSNSAGESAQFYRTSKPLELPVAKATASALRGYLTWSKRIARG